MQKNESATFEHRLDSIKESVRGLVDKGSEQASVIKNKALDAKDVVARNSSKAIRNLGTLIKEHPIAAVGIAFGVGYLVVRLMRR